MHEGFKLFLPMHLSTLNILGTVQRDKVCAGVKGSSRPHLSPCRQGSWPDMVHSQRGVREKLLTEVPAKEVLIPVAPPSQILTFVYSGIKLIQ